MAIYVADGGSNYTVTKRSTFTSTGVAITTLRNTDTFTAPNTTDKAMGLVLFILDGSNTSTSSVFTATLQEDAGAGFVNTALVINATVDKAYGGTLLRFHDATGYTFTTTTANKYRWTVGRTSGGESVTVHTSATNTPAAWFYDSRTGTPGNGDELIVTGQNWQTATTYTAVDGLVIGSTGSNLISPRPDQNTSPAIMVGYNGIFEPDTGDVSIEVKGMFFNLLGHTKLGGTSGTPRTDEFNISFNQNSVDGAYGIVHRTLNSNATNTDGLVTGYFNDGRTRFGQVVSGTGTTGSPLRVSGITGWAIDDPLVIEQTAAIAQNESKFIRTITLVSGTTYDLTLADTAGGAESGLTHTHDSTAQVHNRYRLCTIQSTNSSYRWFYYLNNTSGNNNLDSVKFKHLGIASGTGKTGFTFTATSKVGLLKDMVFEDFIVATTLGTGATLSTAFTGTTLFYNGGTSSRAVYQNGNSNVSFEKLVCIDVGFDGVLMTSGANLLIDEYRAFNCGRDSATTGALRMASAQKMIANNLYFQGNRAGYVTSAGVGADITNAEMGNKIANTVADIVCNANFNTAIIRNANLGSATEVSGYTSMISGSYISITNKDATNYADFTYYSNGIVQRTGSGLADTTTRTVGNYAARIEPLSSTDPVVLRYFQPVEEDKVISAFGFVATNAAFNADTDASAVVELYLPGSTTPDASYTVLKTTTNYQLFALNTTYTEALSSEAEVRITVYANDAGAYLYFADPLNGSNDYTAQRIWRDALPSSLMPATLGDPVGNAVALLQTVYAPYEAAGNVAEALGNANAPTASAVADAVWDELLSGHVTVGSAGKALTDLLAASPPSAAAIAAAVWANATAVQIKAFILKILTKVGL